LLQKAALSEQILESQAAIENKEQDCSIKRVTGFSHLVSGLIEASRNFIWMHFTKKHLNIGKTISGHLKVLFLGPSKNYSSRDTISSREWLIVG
jgi:hypothetical protein